MFTKRAGGWQQTAELKGSDTSAGDWFGFSVAITGTTLVVGAEEQPSKAGRAYVFSRTASGWRQTAELKGSDIVANDKFGDVVSASGGNVVVGGSGHNYGTGKAYVFDAVASPSGAAPVVRVDTNRTRVTQAVPP